MGCLPGRISEVEVSFDNGATYMNLGGIVDATLNTSTDELECTTHDSVSREWIPNLRDDTMDLSMRWDEDDPGQVGLAQAHFPTTESFKLRFYLERVQGKSRFDALAFITAYTPSGPLDDTAGLDVTLRLSNLVRSIQT